jgi:hypothetical protein
MLAERRFLPALERAGGGYVLREHNCPVLELAFQREEIGEMSRPGQLDGPLTPLVGSRIIHKRIDSLGHGASFLGAPSSFVGP